jgi:hypothetical protein
LNILGASLREAGDVNVRDARVLPLGFARRPTHDFDASEPLLRGEDKNLLEVQFG